MDHWDCLEAVCLLILSSASCSLILAPLLGKNFSFHFILPVYHACVEWAWWKCIFRLFVSQWINSRDNYLVVKPLLEQWRGNAKDNNLIFKKLCTSWESSRKPLHRYSPPWHGELTHCHPARKLRQDSGFRCRCPRIASQLQQKFFYAFPSHCLALLRPMVYMNRFNFCLYFHSHSSIVSSSSQCYSSTSFPILRVTCHCPNVFWL